jgi:HAD superfamily hydrolase (TIGR01509 family)
VSASRTCASSRFRPGVAQCRPLAEQIPAAVEFDLDRAEAFLVGLERLDVMAVGVLAVAQTVLLGYKLLDAVGDGLVAHLAIVRPRLCAVVVYEFDVVAIGIEHVRRVIAGVIARALGRAPVARVAGYCGGVVKALHGLVIARRKRHVQVFRRLAGDQRERAGLAVVLHPFGAVVVLTQAGVRGDRVVEGPGAVQVGHPDPQVVDDPAPARALVVDRLGAVAVGVEQERAVVVGPVLGPDARRAVVAVAGVDAGLPGLLDPVAVARHEADVQPAGDRVLGVGRGHAEVLPLAEGPGAVALIDAERLQDDVVEALSGAAVAGAYRHVVEHEADNLRARGGAVRSGRGADRLRGRVGCGAAGRRGRERRALEGRGDRAVMGMSAPEWSRYVRDELRVDLEPEEISDRVVARLLAGYKRHLPLLPGAVHAVKRIAARWPVGLASSANREVIDAVLAASGLAGVFRATVSGEEVARGKPAPDIYLEAARRLGVDPGRSAAVEDSTNWLRSAAAAGMLVVALPTREFPPEPEALALALAAVLLDSLDQLSPALFERPDVE